MVESVVAYSTLNDAFEVRRRCRPEDAIYGLGEKTGRGNRKGRDFTLWNTDVLNPHETREFTEGATSRGRTGAAPSSTRTTSRSRSSTTTPHIAGTMAASFVDNGYRGHYDFRADEEYAFGFEGGQYTEYVFAGPSMPAILEAYTWLTGRTAPPPLWALGYHQCRWFDYTQDAVEALGARHRELGVPCDALWLDIEYMDGYRVFTWNTTSFPDVARDASSGCGAEGFRVITIVDPGVKHEPGYAVFDDARGARRAVPDRGRRHLHRPGLAGRHRVPGLRHRGGARLVGRAQRRARAVRAGRHLERHERAGDGDDPGRADALRPRPRVARALPQPVRAADGDGHASTACWRRCPTCARSCSRARASPASSATPPTGWATTMSRWDHLWLEHRRWRPGSASPGQAVRRRRHRRLRRALQRRAVPALDAVRRR